MSLSFNHCQYAFKLVPSERCNREIDVENFGVWNRVYPLLSEHITNVEIVTSQLPSVNPKIVCVTDRKRSLGQGNILTGVSLSMGRERWQIPPLLGRHPPGQTPPGKHPPG